MLIDATDRARSFSIADTDDARWGLSLRLAAGITRRGARPSAALLARLLAIPWLRSLLRRLERPADERQITLL